ncbi:MAG: DUF4910 domain-containing protein [Planctomycetota bacterium]|nr:MAG: DUF4910 domain-containing protein [Planctomycetota bacterium]
MPRKPKPSIPSGYVINDNLYKTCLRSFSGAQAKRYVEALSAFHRIQASAGFLDAAKYIASELKDAGLDEVKIHKFPSDGKKKYFQWVAPAEWRGHRGVLRMLKPEEKILASFPDIMCALCPGSQKADKVRGQLVFVPGGGGNPSDYKGINVRNKFVLATSHASSVQKEAVMKRGALGTVQFPVDVDDPDKVKYFGLFPAGEELKKFTFSFSISRRTAENLRSLLDKGVKVVLEADVDASVGPGELSVLRASIKGTGKERKEINIISHLCHPSPGANDNASGAAANLEVARTLAHLIKSRKIKRPKHAISFLWVPEFYGTFAYLWKYPDYAKKLLFSINLDMVGEDQHKCNSTLGIVNEPDSMPGVLSDIFYDTLARMRDKGVFSKDGTRNELRFKKAGFMTGSDHAVLAERTFGVPSVALINWPDNFYHSSHDLPENTDASMLKRIGAASLATVLFCAENSSANALSLAAHAAATRRSRLLDFIAKKKAIVSTLIAQGRKKETATIFQKTLLELEAIRDASINGLSTVERISDDPFVQELIENTIEEFDEFANYEIALYKQYMARTAGKYNIHIDKQVSRDAAEKQMLSLVPKLKFKGNLSWDNFRKRLGDKGYGFYRDKVYGGAGEHLWEAMNFADGIKNIHDIYIRVSAEFSNVDKNLILRLFKDLKKTGLAGFKTVRIMEM